jgi:hypothetical protein
VAENSTHVYWIGLATLYGLVSFVIDRVHSEKGFADLRGDANIVLHWIGVIAALQLAHFFVLSGRMADADAGLTKGLILALGMFTAGSHGNWRLMVIGLAVGLATACVAAIKEYLWVLLGLAVATGLVLVYGGRLVRRAGSRSAAD